jgi:hypothetical protein
MRQQYLLGPKWYERVERRYAYGGRDSQILFLGEKSAKLLPGVSVLQLRRRLEKAAAKKDKLFHELMLSYWHGFLLKGERQGCWRRRMFHQGGKIGLGAEYTDSHQTLRKLRLIPDALFCLDNGKRKYWYFLEAETGEKNVDHLMRKLARYSRAREYGLFEKKFPEVTDFFVVVLVRTKRKLENRREAANRFKRLARRVLFVAFEDLDFDHPERFTESSCLLPCGDVVPLLPRLKDSTL